MVRRSNIPDHAKVDGLDTRLKQLVTTCLSEQHLNDPAILNLLFQVNASYQRLESEENAAGVSPGPEALLQSEERYRNMIERSSDIIYKVDQSGAFTYVNPVCERITGYCQDELLGKHFSTLIKQGGRKQAVDFYREQLGTKKKSTYFEFPITSKQGLEVWIGQSVQLSESGNGGIEFTALAIDVTERKNYERHIFVQKEKYLSIITNMNLGLIEVDTDERIQFANHSFSVISGYSEEELIGKKASELFIPDSHRNILSEKMQQRKQGISDMYEIPVRNKKAELRWWLVSGTPNYDAKGKLIGSIGIHLDITEKKQLEAALELSSRKAEESSNAKATFLANMSHEIRTPLNGIIGMIRELSYEKLSSKQQEYVVNASAASEHLLAVLNNVLDISKIEAGELSLEKHAFKLRDTIKEVKTMMKVKAREKGLLLGLDVHEIKGVTYMGDALRIRQILLNLIGNAIKFTATGGVFVECTLKNKNKKLHTIALSVEDTGIGMDEAYQSRLFKKFSQEDVSISRKYGGTGLGMAITYEIIKLMQGSVTVKSVKNEGTRIEVIFDLPLGLAEKQEKRTNVSLKVSVIPTRVLLVEDNAFNRAVAIKTLTRNNCEVTEAVNGQEAIDILATQTFDVVLMDLQMPVMDGFEATRTIRQDMRLTLPIIALTANAFKSELEQCITAGMNDCVTKPFEESSLVSAVKKVRLPLPGVVSVAPLYDLAPFRKLVGGDEAFVQKMITLFIEQTQLALKQLTEAYERNDKDTLSALAHRLKSSLDSLSVTRLHDPVRVIEQTAKDGKNFPLIEKQLRIFNIVIPDLVEQLERELL